MPAGIAPSGLFSFEVPMPVPASLASLSTTPASNQPSGGENPFPDLDDHLRAGYAFDAQNRDAIATKLNASAVSAFGLTLVDDADAAAARATLGAVGLAGNETVAGVKTFSSSPVVPAATTSGQAVNKGQLDLMVALAQFTGSNQQLAASGFQKFPGGLIVQWGNASVVFDSYSITFPTAFPNACWQCIGGYRDIDSVMGQLGSTSLTTTGASGNAYGTGTQTLYWIAIGY